MTMLEKILMLAARNGLDQYEVEHLAALAPKRITKWKDGTGEPTASQALRLARLFKVPVEWLVDDEAAEEPATSRQERPRTIDEAVALIGEREALRRILAGPVATPAEPARFEVQVGTLNHDGTLTPIPAHPPKKTKRSG
jgi:transcriptional regulator with XRE-family HTH domain